MIQLTSVVGRWRATTAAALAALLVLAGCASMSTKTPEEQVQALAEQRWALMIKRDFGRAYQFTQPAYRAVNTPDAYASRFGSAATWKSVQVHEVTCEPERCTVRIRLTTANMVPNFAKSLPELVSYFDETWVRDEGRWWFYQPL